MVPRAIHQEPEKRNLYSIQTQEVSRTLRKRTSPSRNESFAVWMARLTFFQLYILCMSANCTRGELPVRNSPVRTRAKVSFWYCL